MSLNVETKNRKLGIVTNSNTQYHMGLACMVIGIGCVTRKNLADAQARIDLINALDTKVWGEPSIKFTARELEGVQTNVSNETRPKWSKRIIEGFFRERAAAFDRDDSDRGQQAVSENAGG